jgi:hypothetical protein
MPICLIFTAVIVREVDVELPHLKDASADIVQIWRVRDEGLAQLLGERYALKNALLLDLAQLAQRRLDAVHEEPLDPLQDEIVVAGRRLPGVAHDETHRIGHDEREVAEHARRHLLLRQRVDHVADRASEGDAAHRRGLDEEDLADEDLTAREVVHDLV